MQSTTLANLAERFTEATAPLLKPAYETLQQGKAAFGLAHKTLATRVGSTFGLMPDMATQPLPPELLAQMTQKREVLLARDWQDAEAGIYPVSLLFDNPWQDFFTYYPVVWADMPSIWERTRDRRYQTFGDEIDTKGYPDYYLQNFHHQTDGYLSDLSANLYDLQVEILFNGTADPMRRRILAPLKAGLDSQSSSSPQRVLDVACGTGRTLRSLRSMLPEAALYGVDLSPAYLRKANQLLSELPGELPQLMQANAEELPYTDEYFHGVTCVFTFHELPPAARQNVIAEIYRVLKPGGIFVICDSVQAIDSPEMMPMMENFPVMFHEPYYKHYIHDDLVQRLESVGCTQVQTENYLASKYWVASKPLQGELMPTTAVR